MPVGHMGRYWDARAREDAFFFVDNTGRYRAPDRDRFWASGEETLALFGDRLGVAPGPDDVVIDVGCGIGRLTRAIARRSARVLAIDVSTEMLAAARQHNRELTNVEWLQGNGTTLAPIADEAADALLSFVVFQHLPKPALTLGYVREMGRVLRPGGWAAFQVSNDPRVHRGPQRPPTLRERAGALAGRTPRGQRDPAWLGSSVELEELRAAARDGGLEIERVDGEGSQFCLVLLRH